MKLRYELSSFCVYGANLRSTQWICLLLWIGSFLSRFTVAESFSRPVYFARIRSVRAPGPGVFSRDAVKVLFVGLASPK
jgi:hypothetical protein